VGRLHAGNRLTLMGAGSSGKTRLALEVVRLNVDACAGGMALMLLASIRDAPLVMPTIAHAVGLREAGGRPLDSLVAHLRSRRMHLDLDNFEHLLEAAPIVGDLLRGGCPDLAILVTSCEALHLPAEQQFAVAPLELPPVRSRHARHYHSGVRLGAP